MRTMEELLRCQKAIVTPQEVGPLLTMHPQTINLMAKEGTLPFPYIRSGNRTKIPRLALIRWLTGEDGGSHEEEVSQVS